MSASLRSLVALCLLVACGEPGEPSGEPGGPCADDDECADGSACVSSICVDARPVQVPDDLPWISLPLHAVRVSDDDGLRQCPISPDEVARWVDEANRIYEVARIRFVFAADADGPDWTDVRSTLLNRMEGNADLAWLAEIAAGDAIARERPDKVTVIFRYGPGPLPTGGGFSWTDYAFAAMPGFEATWLCGHQNILLFAHELGHYLGLAHTHAREYADLAAAEADYAGDPTIFDGDGIRDTPPDPFVRDETQCDLAANYRVLAGDELPLPRDNVMSYYDSPAMTLSPTQAMRVRQGALVRTGQDLRLLLPGELLPPIEGEVLVGAARARFGAVEAQTDMRRELGNWSGDAQLFWHGVLAARLTLTFPVAEAGSYRVLATLTVGPQHGIHRLAVNDESTGEAIDLYASRVGHDPPRDLGVHALHAGDNHLTVDAVALGPRAFFAGFGLDYLLLERVP
ncbi:hypothetical protein [Nannocystis pusilla]|uniref:EB domain-containing protein n=1 Tax=Nannocystis pusilla TaxID=889268 RepID=UPI003DA69D3C